MYRGPSTSKLEDAAALLQLEVTILPYMHSIADKSGLGAHDRTIESGFFRRIERKRSKVGHTARIHVRL